MTERSSEIICRSSAYFFPLFFDCIATCFLSLCFQNEKDFQMPSVWSVACWDDPKVTLLVASANFASMFFIGILDYSLLTFICRILQIGIAVSFFASQFDRLPAVDSSGITRTVGNLLNLVEPKIVTALHQLVDIAAWRDPNRTLMVLGFSMLVAFLGSTLGDLGVWFLGSVLFFAVPPYYNSHKVECDGLLNDVIASVKRKLRSGTKEDFEKKSQ